MDISLKVNHGVIIGNNDELYLAGGAHSVADFAQGTQSIPEAVVSIFDANIKRRSKFCQGRGIAYAHMVAPEKYVVMPNDFPIPNAKSKFDAFKNICPKEVIYPVEALRNNPHGRSYYKTDSHWTAAGMRLASEEIGRRAGLDENEMKRAQALMESITTERTDIFYGDLGRKFDPQMGERCAWPNKLVKTIRIENGMGHDYTKPVNDGRMVCSFNPESASAKTLLIFGDSYLFNALSYLECIFRKVIFCRTRYFHLELVLMAAPDIVITQNAERYLSATSHDTLAPPFMMIPFMLGRKQEISPEDASFLACFFTYGIKPNFSALKVELPESFK